MGDVDKLLFENFGLGTPRFNATSHLKLKANVLFSQTLMLQCNWFTTYDSH